MAKRLISVKELEGLAKRGEKVVYLDESTLITLAARDMASSLGIEILPCKEDKAPHTDSVGIDRALIYNTLKTLADQGMLNSSADADSSITDAPYQAEQDSSGLKIVKGNSVTLEYLKTGSLHNKVHYREVICSKDSNIINTGFLEIEQCCFDWEVHCDEIYYIIEGSLSISVKGKTYVANTGDVVSLPVGSKIVLGSPGKVKIFYSIKAL